MQVDLEDPEDEDAEQSEPEESVAELCRTPPAKKPNPKTAKLVSRWIGDYLDSKKRDGARESAAIQDSERRYVEDTRYDINAYPGGPVTIPDVCVVEKRKVR